MNLTNNEAALIKEFSDIQAKTKVSNDQSSFVKYSELPWKSAYISEYAFNTISELGALIEHMWTDFKEDDRKKIAKICSVAAFKNKDAYVSNETITEYNYIF